VEELSTKEPVEDIAMGPEEKPEDPKVFAMRDPVLIIVDTVEAIYPLVTVRVPLMLRVPVPVTPVVVVECWLPSFVPIVMVAVVSLNAATVIWAGTVFTMPMNVEFPVAVTELPFDVVDDIVMLHLPTKEIGAARVRLEMTTILPAKVSQE